MNKKNIFRIFSICFASLALSSCSTLDGERKDLGRYEKAFRNSMINACLANPAINRAKNKPKYCVCYANAFSDRYEENTLATINNFSSKSKDKGVAKLVNTMMRPELLVCEKKFGSM